MLAPETLKRLNLKQSLSLSIEGDCMSATLPHGSRVQFAERRVYWPGDIVVYLRPDGVMVSHRFLGYVPGRGGLRVLTMADNAATADVPRPAGQVLGRVCKVGGTALGIPVGWRLKAVVRYCSAVARLAVVKARNAVAGARG